MNGFVHSSLNRLTEARVGQSRERTGGPRSRPPREPRRSNRNTDSADADVWTSVAGSHMPLDTIPHWHWRNPLNLLPLVLLLLLLLALVALLF
ncbi:MAG: hypothetical protein H0X37_25085 [Herpetosiphonaceae bacterium]|nr:hypothetical protein [Herpetosiphonaceae bacterium]